MERRDSVRLGFNRQFKHHCELYDAGAAGSIDENGKLNVFFGDR